MEPINYSRDVLNPIDGYLQGIKFGEGINTDRLNQEATRNTMQVQQGTLDLAERQFQAEQAQIQQQNAAAQAEVAAQRARAEQGSMALMSYLDALENGTATPSQLRQGMAAFPELAEQFQTFASSVSEERLGNEVQFGQQLAFALANNSVDAAEGLLRTRQEAAEAAGDEQGAAVYKAQLIELQQNPQGLLMQTLMPLAGTMPVDDFNKFHADVLGLGADDEATPQSGIAKLQADLAAGLIDQEQYDLGLQNMAPSGMVIESTPGGGFRMVQGAGVGEDDGRMAPSDPSFMIDSIDGILNDPALDFSTGWMSWRQNLPGTEARRFGARARQLEGQAFLQAFESLKGGGQITEIEGLKATQAIGRLDTAQRAEDYREALTELRDILVQAQARPVGWAESQTEEAASPPADGAATTRLRYNPDTGEFE